MDENIFENEQHLPKIDLLEYRGAGLIVPCKSGVWIYNQVGGHACNDHGLEGVFVPIRWSTECLERHFTGPKWGGWCDSEIDAETADLIEAWVSDACRNQRKGVPLKVNRDRMQQSQEAWIWMTLTGPTYLCLGIVGFRGDVLLTWRNSD